MDSPEITPSREGQLGALSPLKDDEPTRAEANKRALHELQDVLVRPENKDLADWYLRELSLLGDLDVEDGEVSQIEDQGGWTEVRNGEKLIGIDARAFKVRRKILNYEGREPFAQPFVENNGQPFTFVGDDGQEHTMQMTGIVAGLRTVEENGESRYLISLRQEAGSHLPKHSKVTAPIQGSLFKFEQVDNGNIVIDPTLATIAEFVQEEYGLSLIDALRQRKINWKILPGADDNRINAYNITFVLDIDPAKKDALTAGGKNRWATGQELDELGEAGLLNGHFTDMAAKTKLVPK